MAVFSGGKVAFVLGNRLNPRAFKVWLEELFSNRGLLKLRWLRAMVHVLVSYCYRKNDSNRGLRQHRFIILQFRRPNVQNLFHWAKKMSAEAPERLSWLSVCLGLRS